VFSSPIKLETSGNGYDIHSSPLRHAGSYANGHASTNAPDVHANGMNDYSELFVSYMGFSEDSLANTASVAGQPRSFAPNGDYHSDFADVPTSNYYADQDEAGEA